ncbi:hypothetical protein CBR_g30943 [Chara braunii]|uniref:CCHC-type domain-containing protein n=1 Tax=Chara braunii TaxID=69332 RepID=A0A388LDV0_CHABU|nr:hypothetical protein CBR_g30943 [Chara braunii]|eukprot:GBG80481.1 hypothetical protein CBR_g30943 [Chara braunii]
MSNNDQRDGGNVSGGGGDHGGGDRTDRRQYRAPTCFNCNEVAHYAHRCPNRGRRNYPSRSSSSSGRQRSRSPRRYDNRRHQLPIRDLGVHSQIADLARSIGAMKAQYDIEARKKEEKARRDIEARKKEEKARRKFEKAEAQRLEEEEAEKRALKDKKKKEKLHNEAEKRAEMRKDLRLEMLMDLHWHEMKDKFIAEIKKTVLPSCFPSHKGKGKMELCESEGYSSSGGSDG